MVTWPSNLPDNPLVNGYRETVPDNIIRTEMDTGVAKIRRRTTAAPRYLQLSYLMSKLQIVTLDDFYLNTLKSGSLKFSYTNPRTGISENVRFLKPPEYTSENANYFKVSINLEIMP